MTNLLKWFRLSNRILRLNRRIDRLESQRRRSDKALATNRRLFDQYQSTLHSLIDESTQALAESKRVQDEYKMEIESAKREVLVMQDTERALVEANRVLLSRWKAETAVHVMQQQGITKSGE